MFTLVKAPGNLPEGFEFSRKTRGKTRAVKVASKRGEGHVKPTRANLKLMFDFPLASRWSPKGTSLLIPHLFRSFWRGRRPATRPPPESAGEMDCLVVSTIFCCVLWPVAAFHTSQDRSWSTRTWIFVAVTSRTNKKASSVTQKLRDCFFQKKPKGALLLFCACKQKARLHLPWLHQSSYPLKWRKNCPPQCQRPARNGGPRARGREPVGVEVGCATPVAALGSSRCFSF